MAATCPRKSSEMRALDRRPRIEFEPYTKLPTPYVALSPSDPGGHSLLKERACAKFRRCSSCGTKIKGEVVFVCDPSTLALVEKNGRLREGLRDLVEPPLHPACAEYSAKVCPRLRQYIDRLWFAYASAYAFDAEPGDQVVYRFARFVTKVTKARTGEIVWEKKNAE